MIERIYYCHDFLSKHSDKFASLFVVLIFGYVIIEFFLGQLAFIENQIGFYLIVFLMVGLSFWSSAMEAAISTTADQSNGFFRKVSKEFDDVRSQYISFAKNQSKNLDALKKGRGKERPSKTVRSFEKRYDHLEKVLVLASGTQRPIYVGAFATLSVFLNLSIGILLPLMMISNHPTLLIIDPPEFVDHIIRTIVGYFGWGYCGKFDATSKSTFLLVITTIPVLLFGKLIPKKIGLNNSEWWLEKNQRACLVVRWWLGWITVGSTWWIRDS